MIKVFNFNKFTRYIKFFILIAILIILIFILQNYSSIGSTLSNSHEINTVFYSCLNDSMPGINITNDSDSSSVNFLQKILYSELPIINDKILINDNTLTSNIVETSNVQNTENEISYASGSAQTQAIPNNVPNTYTDSYNNIEIKNATNYTLSDEDLNPDNLTINTSNIIIFHTHTCESYTPSENYQYEESGTFRTTDLERSVVKVGSELTKYLLSYGYNTIHDTTYHDYPSYDGSYGRSMATVQSLLQTYPNTDIIIDLHRDAIGDTSYAPSVKIGDDVVSQLMFVIGTDGGGMEHLNWRNNLKFAIKVQEKANELYPGLFKPIILRNSRYNQHLGNAACIIEVGATGNTLDESLLSMKYLSYTLNDVLKK